MKKQNFSPLNLDKETIAKLDDAQLNQIVGGANYDDADETNCTSGISCAQGSCCVGGSEAARP